MYGRCDQRGNRPAHARFCDFYSKYNRRSPVEWQNSPFTNDLFYFEDSQTCGKVAAMVQWTISPFALIHQLTCYVFVFLYMLTPTCMCKHVHVCKCIFFFLSQLKFFTSKNNSILLCSQYVVMTLWEFKTGYNLACNTFIFQFFYLSQ